MNQFELIRKYKCLACRRIVMCQCDETRGRRFFPHQLGQATDLETRSRMPVTGGFQPFVCEECRGLAPTAHPKAAIRGRTSKIKRYYWRELAFRRMEIFTNWAEAHGYTSNDRSSPEPQEAYESAGLQALREIKALHDREPKYVYSDVSQDEIVRTCRVEVLSLVVPHLPGVEGARARVLDGGQAVSSEECARRHFSRLGYESLILESVPFHVLFGIYMWILIQDPSDAHVQTVSFGDRTAFDNNTTGPPLWTALPRDFGTPGYGQRREAAIGQHFSTGMEKRKQLDWLFDYWLEPSHSLRQYLWAHREADVATCRKMVRVLPPAIICRILRHLVDDYWQRYLGWPDLLVYKPGEFFFAEVKSSTDKLSGNQKTWILRNSSTLKLPFRLVKLHRSSPRTSRHSRCTWPEL